MWAVSMATILGGAEVHKVVPVRLVVFLFQVVPLLHCSGVSTVA